MVRMSVLAVFMVLGCAAPAAAAPPPLPVPVTVVGTDAAAEGAAARSRALLDALQADGWFAPVASLDPTRFDDCRGLGAAVEACVRSALSTASAGQARPAAQVVVWVEPDGVGARWRCIGVAKAAFDASRQVVEVDLDAALSADAVARLGPRTAAAGCVVSAGAESGW